MKLSLIIPCLDKNDPKLKELLNSIEAQDFSQGEMEVLVITEGTSESSKAIGIRKAKGEVIGILASDNELIHPSFLRVMYECLKVEDACYPSKYYHSFRDDILNRYFALAGGNDPLAYYMRKNDRFSYLMDRLNINGSIGDNGFFIKKSLIEETDLDNYYHIDNAIEANALPMVVLGQTIWHKTGGNIFSFFRKRYRYGLQHAFNKNRRWHLVDFRQPRDIVRLIWFILASLTIIHPLCLSFRGYFKIQDVAWFLHPIICLLTLMTYITLIIHLGLIKLSQLLSAPMADPTA